MLSAPDGIAAGFSLLCLLFALTALPGRTGALTSVKEFLLKLRVRGGLTHTQTHTHTLARIAVRPCLFLCCGRFTLRSEFLWGCAVGFRLLCS